MEIPKHTPEMFTPPTSSFVSEGMTLEKWHELNFLNKFHQISKVEQFDPKQIPPGYELFPNAGSFHYRTNGQADSTIEKYVFPPLESEISLGGIVFFGVPSNDLERRDGVYYMLRKIP